MMSAIPAKIPPRIRVTIPAMTKITAMIHRIVETEPLHEFAAINAYAIGACPSGVAALPGDSRTDASLVQAISPPSAGYFASDSGRGG